MAKERFLFLDGLRGFAAAIVGWLHATQVFNLSGSPLPNAPLAVDFFFCLSGFVVAHAYDQRLQGEMSLQDFIWRRAIRLYPMIALGVALGAISSLFVGIPSHEVWKGVFGGLLLIPLGLPGLAFRINPVIWSLFFEVAAYFAYAMVAARMQTRWLAIALLTGSALLGLTIVVTGGVYNFGLDGIAFLGGFLRAGVPFGMGVLLSRSGYWRRLPATPPWIVAIAFCAFLLLPISNLATIVLSVLVGIPLMVILGASVRSDAKVWEYLGRFSYPFYLVHFPVHRMTHQLSLEMPSGLAAGSSLLLAAGLAWLSLRLYDEPLRAWLTKRISRAPGNDRQPRSGLA